MEGKLNYEHAVQLIQKASTICLVNTLFESIFVAGMQRCFLLFYRILQVTYIFPSNITIFMEHEDNFDKSSLKFLASIR